MMNKKFKCMFCSSDKVRGCVVDWPWMGKPVRCLLDGSSEEWVEWILQGEDLNTKDEVE